MNIEICFKINLCFDENVKYSVAHVTTAINKLNLNQTVTEQGNRQSISG